MDWLNAAMEEFTFSLNDKLSHIPEQHEFHFNDLINVQKINKVSLICAISSLSRKEAGSVAQIFDIELHDDTIINYEDKTLSHPVVLKKTVPVLMGDQLLYTVGVIVANSFTQSYNLKSTVPKLNEIMDLINCKEQRTSKSIRRKFHAIETQLSRILKDDLWKIRNMDLYIKAWGWAVDYIENGNLHAITNLTKLKCMTHTGNPIYSMKEID